MVDYIGQRLGNYQLTRLLGEGGFAQVYLGEHIYLSTQAAIKILNTQLDNDQDWFRTEARTIARLVHPNIVRVLDFGVEGNTPFLVMDYAPKGTLRQRHPKGTLLPLSTVVSYVKQIAEALQYAHDEKLIHRDVKPENMLLGRSDEVLLSDFGIALMSQTMLGLDMQNMAGTLAYMAPEQIQGYPRRASDQYALSIIVYEWLTGDRPFDGSFTEVISQQLAVSPLPLRTRMPAVAPAVEQVVMRALEKDPDRRFDSIRAFALALEQASQLDVLTSQSADQRAATSTEAVTPLPSKMPVVPPVSEVAPVPPPALPPTVYAAPIKPAGTLVCSYQGHTNTVRSLSWSPDSTRIISVSNEKAVHIWDAMTGNKQRIYQDKSDAVHLVAEASDGLRVATAGADALVRVWDFATNVLVATYRGHIGHAINALAWSPKQQLLASAATDGTVHVWDATTGQPITIYRGHTGSVNTLAWSPDELSPPRGRGYYIVSFAYASENKTIEVWDTMTNLKLLTFSHTAPIRVMAWSPDGKYIASGGGDTTIQVWVAP